MRLVSSISNICEKLGRGVGQNQKLVIEGIGAAILVPLIVLSHPVKTNEEKHDQNVQATRLSLTAIVRKLVGLAFSIPIGIKIVHMAQTGKLAGLMNARLVFDTKNINSADQFIHMNKLKNLKPNHIEKIQTIFDQTKMIESQKGKLDTIESLINDQLLTHNLWKDKRYSSPHQIVNLKNLKPELSTIDKSLVTAANDYVHLSQSIKLNLDTSTRHIKELLSSQDIHSDNIKSLDHAIVPNLPKAFTGYQFVMQWIGYLVAIPFSAEVINHLFKPLLTILFKDSSKKHQSGAH